MGLQEKLAKIQRELKAPKNQFNAFGKYHYRSCEDILEAVKPLLNGLLLRISDKIVMVGNRYYVEAHALISDGDESIGVFAYAREEETKKGMDGSQITGSSSSYARKYALNGMFLIDDTKDADTTNKGKDAPQNPKKSSKESKYPFSDFLDVLQRIGKMKGQIVDIDGNDKAYYEALDIYGLKHANEFKTREAMIDFGKDLKSYIDKRLAENG